MASKEQIEDDAYQAFAEWSKLYPAYGLTVTQIERLKMAFVAGYLEGRKDGKA